MARLSEREYAAAYRKGDHGAFRGYLDEWVTGPADHDAYLEKIGIRRFARFQVGGGG